MLAYAAYPTGGYLGKDLGAISASDKTCYDNGGNAGQMPKYSLSRNEGSGVNCALSFEFQ